MPESQDHDREIITRPTTRWDWKVIPMPRRTEKVQVNTHFTQEEIERLRLGFWPQVMEEKWFVFWEDPYLYLHRSWTGLLMFRVRFEPDSPGYRAVEVLVNRNRREYKTNEPGEIEAEKALFLINQFFLPERRQSYPKPSDPEKDIAFLKDWSFLGATLFQEPLLGTPVEAWIDSTDLKAYWVVPGRLLAGFYPGDPDPGKASYKTGWLIRRQGIRCFINLVQEGEANRYSVPLRSYSADVEEAARESKSELLSFEASCLNFPIPDQGVPSIEQMRTTLDAIDRNLHCEQPVYLHCLGGRGRTGTVVGCYLIRHGMATPENVFEVIRRLRAKEGLDRDGDSPETGPQRRFVSDWIKHDRGFRRIPSLVDQFRGCLLGLAAGDALGTTLEFKRPGEFEPISDMVGGGPFSLRPGQWTDDTSMALCLADSLLSCGGFDAADQLRRYVRWWRTGYMSSTGSCFDIGNATRAALENFVRTQNVHAGSSDPQKGGNGSIMRLAPIPLFYFDNPQKAVDQAGASSLTTHGTRTCVDACKLMSALIVGALQGLPKDQILDPGFWPVSGPMARPGMHGQIDEIAAGSYQRKNPPEIAGTGFVVRSLEAALWAFYRSDSFKEGALLAVNLGEDADTTGAVYGQLAGAYYGESGIPPEWLDKLHDRQLIGQMAERLLGAI